MQNIDAVTIEVVALRASESQRKLKAATPSESVWLSLGLLSALLGMIAQLHASTCFTSQQNPVMIKCLQ